GLFRQTLNLVHTQSLPQARLPFGIACLECVRVLVITKSDIGQFSATKERHPRIEILAWFVVVNLVLLTGPVVAVTKTENRVVDARQVQITRVLDNFPKAASVLGELSLTSSTGDENNVFFRREI